VTVTGKRYMATCFVYELHETVQHFFSADVQSEGLPWKLINTFFLQMCFYLGIASD